MGVLAIALCTRTGRALLSRQFVETTRHRVEGLLVAFPKLVSDASASGKQHTFVETDTVRYVYMPLDAGIYLVLITGKGSNIIEDLDTLRLLSKVVPEQVGGSVSEEAISSHAFELIFAFDEVVSSGGYREDVTLHTIRTNLEMESHEEKLAAMIKASRQAAAAEESKRQAAAIKAKRLEEERMAALSGAPRASGGGGKYASLSSTDVAAGGGSGGYSGGGGSYGSSSSSGSRYDAGSAASAASSAAAPAAAPARKPVAGATGGLKLGAGKKPGGLSLSGGAASGGLAGLIAEEGMRERDMMLTSSDASAGGSGAAGGGSAAAAAAAATASAAAAVAEQAHVALEEHVTTKLTRDGTIESMVVKGSLTLTIADESVARLAVALARGPSDKLYQYQTHPQVNKAAFASASTLVLKDPAKPLPVGPPVGMLRWTRTVKDTEATGVAPVTITCWPEAAAGGGFTVSLEYTLQDTSVALEDLTITVPLGGDVAPRVASCSVGDWRHNAREHSLVWSIGPVGGEGGDDASTTGNLEFSVKGVKSEDAFFPVAAAFSSTVSMLSGLDVTGVTALAEDGTEGKGVRFRATKALSADSYTVE